MWIKLANATFPTHLGSINSLIHSYIVSYSLSGNIIKSTASGSCPTSVIKAQGENYASSALEATFLLNNGAEILQNGVAVVINGALLTRVATYQAESTTTYYVDDTTTPGVVVVKIPPKAILGNVYINITATTPPVATVSNYTFTINPTPINSTVILNATDAT